MSEERRCTLCRWRVGEQHHASCLHTGTVLAEQADPPARGQDGCPDGGTCHHECERACWRVFNAEPLSAARWGSSWPAEVRAAERAALMMGPKHRPPAPTPGGEHNAQPPGERVTIPEVRPGVFEGPGVTFSFDASALGPVLTTEQVRDLAQANAQQWLNDLGRRPTGAELIQFAESYAGVSKATLTRKPLSAAEMAEATQHVSIEGAPAVDPYSHAPAIPHPSLEVTDYGRTYAWTAEGGETIDGLPAAVVQALDAAREVDKLFDGEPGCWTLDGQKVDDDAAHALLSLHDYLNDLAIGAELAREGELSDPEEKVLGPFAAASETSRRAALEAWPKQGTQRWHILHAFRVPSEYRSQSRTGWTRDELARVLFLSPNTIRPRVRELILGGWVEVCRPRLAMNDDSPLTRDSDAGHESEVLILTAAAFQRIALARASA